MKYLTSLLIAGLLCSCGSKSSSNENEITEKVIIDNDETAWMIDTTYFDWSNIEMEKDLETTYDRQVLQLHCIVENDSDFGEDDRAMEKGIYEWPKPRVRVQTTGHKEWDGTEFTLSYQIFMGFEIETASDPVFIDMEFLEEHRLTDFKYYMQDGNLVVEHFYLFDPYIEEGAVVKMIWNPLDGTQVETEIWCGTCG